MFLAIIYLLFFLSGSAALVYQLVWVRSLTLVFGGSHLAVTAVLSMFMAGLALGSYVIGRRVDDEPKPLRLYGLLELGIAASAVVFAALMWVYPAVYVALARGREGATLYLAGLRLLFAFAALIVPTALMGATLPVLTRFIARQPEALRSHLSFLYGVNTLGAVSGALLAGFVLLRWFSVSLTLSVAIATNTLIGIASILLQRKLDAVSAAREPELESMTMGPIAVDSTGRTPVTLIVWGIGLSGFCALAYEVLWTRVLTMAVGASVYGFTIILVAFLTGIALGSSAYGAASKVLRRGTTGAGSAGAWFGATQVLIGISALLVTVSLRDIPVNAVRLQSYFLDGGLPSFESRVWASFLLAFLYLVVPALFMGAAFPIAGEAVARQRGAVGRAVGEVLAANTVGAILGAAVSGFVMIRLFGIERSLQLLTVINVGLGLAVLASLLKRRWITAAAAVLTLGSLAALAMQGDAARLWNRKYFAIFRSNQPEAFRTPEMVREAVENTDVLYYAEGTESIVSVIRVKGAEQAFLTNGRVEASSHRQAQQNQYTLGHLPMLLARHPKQVLVVGLGSGMTAGATAVHPGVERVTIAEIEPQVKGVARTFEQYNHRVLDNPKVTVVIEDGRNFLLTTTRKFDVITADPIHPWFRGAGYLYSREYFKLVAEHLQPGGVAAQWLPIYELTPRDLASVVKTFQQQFPHTMMWLAHNDSIIVGSAAPFAIDEEELDRRISTPPIAADLARVEMGSGADFLSYFVMGTDGMRQFAKDGIVNTDNRLYLEFSAPLSMTTPAVMEAGVKAIVSHRESLLPYLKPAEHPMARAKQEEKWSLQLAAAKAGDPALGMFLAGGSTDRGFLHLMQRLGTDYPFYAPGRFLASEYQGAVALEPRLLQQSSFAVLNEDGRPAVLELSAVLVPVSRTRASVMFVDNRARAVYGQKYLDDYDRDGRANLIAVDIMSAVRTAYEHEATAARQQRRSAPSAARTLSRIQGVVTSKVQRAQPAS